MQLATRPVHNRWCRSCDMDRTAVGSGSVAGFFSVHATGLSNTNYETQVDDHDIPKDPQDYPMQRSHEHAELHAPSRFLSRFSISTGQIDFGFFFSFLFLSTITFTYSTETFSRI